MSREAGALGQPGQGQDRRDRLVLATAGFVVFLTFVLVYAGSAIGHASWRRVLEDRVFMQAEAANVAMEHLLRRTTDGLELLFRLLEHRQFLQAQGVPERAAGIEFRLAEIAREHRFAVLQIALIDPDGWVRWSTLPDAPPVQVGDRAHFRVHLEPGNSLYVSAPVRGRIASCSSSASAPC